MHGSVGGPTPPFFNQHTQQFFPQASPNQPTSFQYHDTPAWQNRTDANNRDQSGFSGIIDPSLTLSGDNSGRSNSFAWQPQQQQQQQQVQSQQHPTSQHHLVHNNNNHNDQNPSNLVTPFQSLPPSRGGSVTPDDILAPEEIINPLGAMSTMAGSLEAAVRKKKQDRSASTSDSLKRPAEGDGFVQPGKKARESPILPHGPVIQEAQNLPPQSSKDRAKKAGKKTHIHAYPDIVEEGYVTEAEGKELMNM
jgi:hypothetical protein